VDDHLLLYPSLLLENGFNLIQALLVDLETILEQVAADRTIF
jgi:hypothetical protein